ncbi:MAG: hypothetical protein JWN61_1789 [Pseudonocardiales bacterium]|nr:hypothetical protein [Pseudonocardiales bacterium]
MPMDLYCRGNHYVAVEAVGDWVEIGLEQVGVGVEVIAVLV